MHKISQATIILALSSSALAQGSRSQPAQGAANVLDCVNSLRDSGGGACVEASSIATLGKLLPYPGENNSFEAPSVVAGGRQNVILGDVGSVGGGRFNEVRATYGTIGGGNVNFVGGAAQAGTIGGGAGNSVDGAYGTVAGGDSNTADFLGATVGGGRFNTAGSGFGSDGAFSTVGGGYANFAQGTHATISGGVGHLASGYCGVVSGGYYNSASGDYSFAAGRQAKANHTGAFVWGDSFGANKTSSAADQFNVYASGGTRIFSDTGATTGVLLAPGAGSWTSVSDRNAKENFECVDGQAVLDRLSSIPISVWNYRSQDASVRHMGPMAQDFYAAFGLGLGDKGIDTIDADGVALAAIQGLHEQLAQTRAENVGLRRDLAALEATVASLAAGQ